MSFIYILVQILDRGDGVAYLNIDMAFVPQCQDWVVWYYPAVVKDKGSPAKRILLLVSYVQK